MMCRKLFILFFSAAFLLACADETGPEPGGERSVTELRTALKALELESPLEYLTQMHVTMEPASRKVRKAGPVFESSWVNDGLLIKGIIKNDATLAVFRDVQVSVRFRDERRRIDSEHQRVIYSTIPPGESRDFAMKFSLEEPPSSFEFIITGAEPVYQ